MTDVFASLNVPSLCHEHIANHAFAEHLDRPNHERIVPALSAMLNDDLVTSRGIDQHPAFKEIVTTWFFDVDVLSGFTPHDGGRCVPVVGRGNHDRVDRLVVQHSSQVTCRLLCPSIFLQILRTTFVRIACPSNLRNAFEGPAEILRPSAASDKPYNRPPTSCCSLSDSRVGHGG